MTMHGTLPPDPSLDGRRDAAVERGRAFSKLEREHPDRFDLVVIDLEAEAAHPTGVTA